MLGDVTSKGKDLEAFLWPHLQTRSRESRCYADNTCVVIDLDNQECQLLTAGQEDGRTALNLVVKGLGSKQREPSSYKVLMTCFLVVVGGLSVFNLWRGCGHAMQTPDTPDVPQDLGKYSKVEDFSEHISRMKRQSRGVTFAQLSGLPSGSPHTVTNDTSSSLYYILWNETSFPNVSNVRIVRDWLSPVRRVQGLGVMSAGIYLVYSQVAIHGRQQDTHTSHYDCSHVTIRVRQNQPVVLLKSLITQNNGGHRFRHRHGIQRVVPSDTGLQMGLFLLQVNDEIRVGYSSSCDHITYDNDPSNSNFGLIKLGSLPTSG